MSQLKVNTIQHTGGGNVALTLSSSGNVTFSNAVTFSSNNVTIGGSAISPAVGMRNRIINGDMRIDQRNAGASVTPADFGYTVDRWVVRLSQSSKFSVQQNAGSVTPPSGFDKYVGVTSLSAYTVGASENFAIRQNVEGFNMAGLDFGKSTAKPITVSFWVRSSLTGTFGLSLFNGDTTRGFVTSYTISAANTWEYKTIIIPGCTDGTWDSANLTSLVLQFILGYGSSISGSTSSSWITNPTYYSATGATSVVGTNGATLYITGVQLEEGSNATPFERRLYGTELALCQRYCEYVGAGGSGATTITINAQSLAFKFAVPKRAAPTVTHVANYSVLETGTAIHTATVTNIDTATTSGFTALITFSSAPAAVGRAMVYRSNTDNILVTAEL